MNYDGKRIKYYLSNILSISSPSGYTNKIMNYIKEELNSLGISYKVSNKGVLIAYIKGTHSTSVRTFTAHVDTLGAMVKSIKSNGALSIVPIGGFMMNCVEGENCTVETMDGKSYNGTIQTIKPSVHISGDEARELKRTAENMELILDEKVSSKEQTQALGINVGDFVCIDTRTIFTEKDFIKSRYLDDKASVAVLLYVMEHMSKEDIIPLYDTYFYISNYEEVGHGARASLPENTKEFIAVDMGAPGLDQNSSEYSVCICAKDSSGPYDYELRKKLVDTCKKHNIDYRIDIYPHYGSDASAALSAGYDIKAALIGPGVFASHAYERTHMDSILATIDLIVKYCQED
jgi:putative aminopeptidase FrvX